MKHRDGIRARYIVKFTAFLSGLQCPIDYLQDHEEERLCHFEIPLDSSYTQFSTVKLALLFSILVSRSWHVDLILKIRKERKE